MADGSILHAAPTADMMPKTAHRLKMSLKQMMRRRWAAMSSERDSWIPHWRDLSDFILPRRGRYFQDKTNSKGGKINTNIVDTTGTVAHRTLAAGMMAGITSPARPWFRLVTPDADLNESAAVKEWLADVERRMRQVFSASNFYNSLHTLYEELGLFGTAAMVILEDYDNVIRCETLTAGEYCLALNSKRVADTMYRQMKMSVGQIVQEFGFENCSPAVQAAFENGRNDEWVSVMHAIEPNTMRDPAMMDSRNFAYRNVYWEDSGLNGITASDQGAGGPGEKFLRYTGFEESALVAPRWDVIGSDIYGRSPGMDALPDVRQLQIQQKRKGEAIDKVVRPPMQGPPSTQDRFISTLPGAYNVMAEFAQGGAKPMYEVRPDIAALREDIQETQLRVRQAFFADLFLMISQMDGVQPRQNLEMMERKEEKMIMLGPVLERLQNELLDPAIDRVFGIMMRNGVLPEPPEELDGVRLQVDYISILAQAQKGVATAGVERLVGFVGSLAGAMPDVLDKLDADQSVDEMADMLGVPPSIVRPDDKVEAIRASRAQQKQMAQLASAMPAVREGAQAAQILSETDVGAGKTALQQMIGGL